jgi:hypothetical protein
MLEKRFFRKSVSALEVLTRTELLLSASIPLERVLERSGLAQYLSDEESLGFIVDPLRESLRSWKASGGSLKDSLAEISDEAWFHHEQEQEKWLKMVESVKFGVLSIFFLGSYFVAMLELFSGFLAS